MENELGALLLSHRTANGHSLELAARRCGVRLVTIRRWQKGEAKPSALKMPKLAKYLGVSVERAEELYNTPAVNRKEVARGA